MSDTLKYMVQSWQNVANSFPDMRYPNYNLKVNAGLSNETFPVSPRVWIVLETFIQNEGGTRICLVNDKFDYAGQYKPEMLEESLKRFNNKCKLTKEKYIYTINTSIREPFDFNK